MTPTIPDGPLAARRLLLRSQDYRALDSAFSLDSRALSVLRILLALLVIVEALLGWGRPRNFEGPIQFVSSVGDILTAPLAVVMLLGWKTRLAVVGTWLAYSIHVREALVTPGMGIGAGRYILCLALFWCMFLPMGRHLSIDRRGQSQPAVRFLSVASAAFVFQVFVIYFSAGLTKNLEEWVFDATAMATILSHAAFETTPGLWLLQFPGLLSVLSVATVLLEVVGSLLVIVPGKTLPVRRLVMVPVFVAFHVGIAIFMGIGLFPFVSSAIWLAFLPGRVWDWLWLKFGAGPAGTTVAVDRAAWRNALASVAVGVASVSNAITLLYLAEPEGWAAAWQTMALQVPLFQQWAMFSLPSSLG